jgi:hypothetical protein
MGDLSTFYSLAQLLYSEVYSLPCRGKLYTSFVRFAPRNLVVFEAIVNGIVFIYSFSLCSLLVYSNANDFSMLILCLTTLL